MLTGLALPVCLRLIVQSSEPRPNFSDKIFRMENSKGFRKPGSFNCNSNCLPFSDLTSTRNVLSPTACSARPKPVIDLSIVILFMCGNMPLGLSCCLFWKGNVFLPDFPHFAGLHAIDAEVENPVADQPQCWKTHPGRHLTDLPVLSFG